MRYVPTWERNQADKQATRVEMGCRRSTFHSLLNQQELYKQNNIDICLKPPRIQQMFADDNRNLTEAPTMFRIVMATSNAILTGGMDGKIGGK